jgi:hypothetical protein
LRLARLHTNSVQELCTVIGGEIAGLARVLAVVDGDTGHHCQSSDRVLRSVLSGNAFLRLRALPRISGDRGG